MVKFDQLLLYLWLKWSEIWCNWIGNIHFLAAITSPGTLFSSS